VLCKSCLSRTSSIFAAGIQEFTHNELSSSSSHAVDHAEAHWKRFSFCAQGISINPYTAFAWFDLPPQAGGVAGCIKA
jgi:hypothetical protein